jgi:hypothetical protein
LLDMNGVNAIPAKDIGISLTNWKPPLTSRTSYI